MRALLIVLASLSIPQGAVLQTPASRVIRPTSSTGGVQARMFAGALLKYDTRFCLDKIPCLTSDRTIFVRPGVKGPQYFWWNVARVPGAGAVRWQVLDTALPADALGSLTAAQFEANAREASRQRSYSGPSTSSCRCFAEGRR
jgi:hypothetical protein